ncbi:MAG: trypsin-like peptidase domain-containing protein [Saprospiraceae bacterium]|nr:trypsin-like peptidase domain-containing protein [Saprospiraceae bacterium]
MPNAQDSFIHTVRALIEENELAEAIRLLTDFDKQVEAGVGNDVRMQSAKLKEADKMFKIDGIIELKDYKLTTAQVRNALFSIVDDLPDRLALNNRVRTLDSGFAIEVPEEEVLEKVLGPKSHLLQINWLEKAIHAAKAVCRVVRNDGVTGTGFVTDDGYLFTNHHVLPDAQMAAGARVEFNYELDANGNAKNQVAYRLDTADFKCSPPRELDFARVRIVDRPEQPLKQWGFLAFETQRLPAAGDPVTIIQHPNGLDKHIALRANEVISVWNQHLFYTTDTEPGSSGSPVFNADWKVVAIHHAGKDAAQGGLQINAAGEHRPANRGVLFSHIFAHLGLAPSTTTPVVTSATTGASGQESNPATNTATTTTTPAPKPEPQVQQPPTSVPKFLIVYDLADETPAKNLKKHLNISILTKKLKAHFVHEVPAGDDPLERARQEMADSQYIVALISVNLFNSPDWFALVLEAMGNGRSVVPVRLSPVNLDGTGLETRKSLPSRNRTVQDFPTEDAAFTDVVEGLKGLR